MEYWNDVLRRRTTRNLLFAILTPVILQFQQSIIPNLREITLMDNGVLQKGGKFWEDYGRSFSPESLARRWAFTRSVREWT